MRFLPDLDSKDFTGPEIAALDRFMVFYNPVGVTKREAIAKIAEEAHLSRYRIDQLLHSVAGKYWWAYQEASWNTGAPAQPRAWVVHYCRLTYSCLCGARGIGLEPTNGGDDQWKAMTAADQIGRLWAGEWPPKMAGS